MHVTFDGTTPIERIDMYGWLRNGQSQFSVFKALTENCADTNGRCFAIRKKTDRRYLFLHVHAWPTEGADLYAHVSLMRISYIYGADLDAMDVAA